MSKLIRFIQPLETVKICGRVMLFLLLTNVTALSGAPQAEGFRKLTGPQIQQAFTGKQFGDGIHFSYRYAPGGTMEGMRMGKKASGKWAVANDRLCITDSFGENCYAVWVKGAAAKLTIDKSDFALEGFLK